MITVQFAPITIWGQMYKRIKPHGYRHGYWTCITSKTRYATLAAAMRANHLIQGQLDDKE
jgi:hypothetical protein